jgi:ATP-dependent DNA helicase RecQ
MRLVYGIGDTKLREYGERFLSLIQEECARRQLSTDNAAAAPRAEEPRKAADRPNPQRALAFEQFRRGATIEDVMSATGRTRGTVVEYLAEYLREERPASLAPWISEAVYQRVAMAVRRRGMERLKPIYIELGESVPYDDIRLVVAHLAARSPGKHP